MAVAVGLHANVNDRLPIALHIVKAAVTRGEVGWCGYNGK